MRRKIREPSARQLPTNDDHEGGFGRSSDISVINRRQSAHLAADSFTSSFQRREQRKIEKMS
jgi:hypothetical protein